MNAEYSFIGASEPNVFKYTRNLDHGVVTSVTTNTGTIRNAGGFADLWSYGFRRANSFEMRMEETVNMNAMSYKCDMSMNVDGQLSTAVGEISVTNLDVVENTVSLRYVEKIDFKENCPHCHISEAMGYPCPVQMDSDFTLTVEASECNQPSRDCRASINVSGIMNEEAMSGVLGYTAFVQRGTQINQIGITVNDKNMFKVTTRTPSASTVTNVFVKCGDDKQEHIITLPNRRSYNLISRAMNTYFGEIEDAVYFILESLPEAVIWFDKVIVLATDEFDCTPLVQASQVRIPVLNSEFQQGFYCPVSGTQITGNNFQEFGAAFCEHFNVMVKGGLTQIGTEIAVNRRYVNSITSPAHGAEFIANL